MVSRFPQSNAAPAPSTPARRPPLPSETSRFSRPPIKCFRCGGAHHIRHCPEPPNNNNNNSHYNNNNNNYRNKSSSHPAWRYVEPKDLTKPVIDETGNVWKFCTKCVCNKTGRTGLYLKSHFDHEHNSSHETFNPASRTSSYSTRESPKNSANLAVPRGTHARGSIPKLASDEDPLEFQGAWCASVSTAASFEDPPALPVLSSSSSPYNTTAPSTVDCYVAPSPSTVDCYVASTASFMGLCPEQDLHPIIFDTGASLAITYNKPDFDGPLSLPKGDLRLGGMANGLKIEGIGLVTWTFVASDGFPLTVQGLSYYVPQAPARLLSPQRLFDSSNGVHGHYEGDHLSFRLYIQGAAPLIVEYNSHNSLPIAYARIGSVSSPLPSANLSLLDPANQNLTGGQKLLLHWHYRFGHLNLASVQRILRAVPFHSMKFAAASKCDASTIKCPTCEYAKAHRRSKKSVTHVLNAERIGGLKAEHLRPGIQVSVDHFESRLLGRTFDSFGKASSPTYKGGCIFVDHCSGFLFVEPQLGFSSVESIRAKQAFESMALQSGVVVDTYLTDSGAFKANTFVRHIREREQRIQYCGANAHHKNGVAERAVRSVSNMARALLLHASTHWQGGLDSSYWPMAVTYATYLYNHLPTAQGLCPADIFTGSTVPRHRLKDIHVWGCPVYVLDPHLQEGKNSLSGSPAHAKECFSVSAPCTRVKYLWCLTKLLAASPRSFTWFLTIFSLPSLRSKGRMIRLITGLNSAWMRPTFLTKTFLTKIWVNGTLIYLLLALLSDIKFFKTRPIPSCLHFLFHRAIPFQTLPSCLPIQTQILPCLLVILQISHHQAYPPLILSLFRLRSHQLWTPLLDDLPGQQRESTAPLATSMKSSTPPYKLTRLLKDTQHNWLTLLGFLPVPPQAFLTLRILECMHPRFQNPMRIRPPITKQSMDLMQVSTLMQ